MQSHMSGERDPIRFQDYCLYHELLGQLTYLHLPQLKMDIIT